MRIAAFDHVRRLGETHDHLTATELKPGFAFQSERIPLINPQRGIFKPQRWLREAFENRTPIIYSAKAAQWDHNTFAKSPGGV